MSEQHIALIKKQIRKLDEPDFDLESWKIGAQLVLTTAFRPDDPKIKTIRDLKIDYSSTMLRDSSANYNPVESCKRKGREVLELGIEEIKIQQNNLPNELLEMTKTKNDKALDSFLNKQKKETLVQWLKQILDSK